MTLVEKPWHARSGVKKTRVHTQTENLPLFQIVRVNGWLLLVGMCLDRGGRAWNYNVKSGIGKGKVVFFFTTACILLLWNSSWARSRNFSDAPLCRQTDFKTMTGGTCCIQCLFGIQCLFVLLPVARRRLKISSLSRMVRRRIGFDFYWWIWDSIKLSHKVLTV